MPRVLDAGSAVVPAAAVRLHLPAEPTPEPPRRTWHGSSRNWRDLARHSRFTSIYIYTATYVVSERYSSSRNSGSTERAMQAKELVSLQEHPRRADGRPHDTAGRSARPPLVNQEPFRRGYIAGWHSVRGADDQPIFVPPSPVFVEQTMYMVGFSRGARDAGHQKIEGRRRCTMVHMT